MTKQDPLLTTPRLVLRQWQPSDLAPWTAMNQDLRVRQYLSGKALSDAQAAEQMRDRQDEITALGWGRWAAALRVAVGTLPAGTFVGCIGIGQVQFVAPFNPGPELAVELAWRLSHAAWGHGLAGEGALAAAAFAFERVGLKELVAFTALANTNSQRVMQKIGMTHTPTDDFDDPRSQESDPMRRHVLMRLKAQSKSAG